MFQYVDVVRLEVAAHRSGKEEKVLTVSGNANDHSLEYCKTGIGMTNPGDFSFNVLDLYML